MNTTIKKRIEEINSGRVPEGYEKTPFGIFPCDWEKVSLGEVSAKKGEYGLNAPACEYKEGLPKYLRITDIDDQGRYMDNNACVNDADSHKYVLNNGDIVFARTGASVGKNYIYDEKDGILVYAGFLIKFSIKPQYNAYLVCSNCRTKKYDNWVAKMCARSGQPGINSEEYATYSFIIPKSAQEQSRIAEILMQWDKAIELQEKLIKSYQKLKKYYLSKMFPKKGSLYPEIRFAGFTEPWENCQVFEIADRFDNLRVPVAANLRDSGDIPYYGANGIQDYVNGFTHDGEFVLVAEDGANDLINYPVQYVNGRIWVNNHAHVLQGKPNLTDNLFFAYSLHRADIASYLVGGSRAKLNADTLMMLELKLPSIVEQRKIGRLFDGFDKRTNLHQSALNHLIKQRKVLQQYLLTGIVRV